MREPRRAETLAHLPPPVNRSTTQTLNEGSFATATVHSAPSPPSPPSPKSRNSPCTFFFTSIVSGACQGDPSPSSSTGHQLQVQRDRLPQIHQQRRIVQEHQHPRPHDRQLHQHQRRPRLYLQSPPPPTPPETPPPARSPSAGPEPPLPPGPAFPAPGRPPTKTSSNTSGDNMFTHCMPAAATCPPRAELRPEVVRQQQRKPRHLKRDRQLQSPPAPGNPPAPPGIAHAPPGQATVPVIPPPPAR